MDTEEATAEEATLREVFRMRENGLPEFHDGRIREWRDDAAAWLSDFLP